jgi:ribonuclease G
LKELIINSDSEGVTIALLKDRSLAELHQEQLGNHYSVGDIYLGRIKKIMPGLNAAFVDVGYEKDAFLHYFDLGAQVNSVLKFARDSKTRNPDKKLLSGFTLEKEIQKSGKISEVLTKNQLIPVQITKEPISTKGPRLSVDLSLAGRFVVLVPFIDTVSVSKKIKSNAERNRLKRLIEDIRPKNFGIIIRTVSEGRGQEELQKDVEELCEKWATLTQKLPITEPTKKILGEIDRTSSILRDILNADFQSIILNDPDIYEEVKSYIHGIAPEQEKIVKLYKGKDPLFEHFGIDKQIKALFGKTVTMMGGAYLVIEHTEALHVIDVNSGNRTNGEQNQEENALQVNMEAAREIARQLRLRDMGGIIVIDFIDMHKPQNRKELFDALRKEMSDDRAKHTILPPSRFGLVQITRQRVRPEMNIVTVEKCPACGGTGEVRPNALIKDDIKNALSYLLSQNTYGEISLKVNPIIGAYLRMGWHSLQISWFLKFKKWIKIKDDSTFHFLEFHFYSKGEEIKN